MFKYFFFLFMWVLWQIVFDKSLVKQVASMFKQNSEKYTINKMNRSLFQFNTILVLIL